MRRIFVSIIAVLSIIAAVFFLGPREPYSGEMSFDVTQLGNDLDAYLAKREGAYNDIREGLHKQIIWADSDKKQKTDFSIVYIHSFSGSSADIRPVPDLVAKNLGANLFFTRLTGHGRTSHAMAEARPDDWLNDVLEAVTIGEKIGEKVIVVATSMGGSLATLFPGAHPELVKNIAGYVLISPNYEVLDPTAVVLTWPWARHFVPMIIGDMRGQTYENEKINHAWTLPHASQSLVALGKVRKEFTKVDLETIGAPALFIYSPNDQVISAKAIEDAMSKWGGPTDKLVLEKTGHILDHVIVGDILSPETNEIVITTINEWIAKHFQN